MSPRPHSASPRSPESDQEILRRVLDGDVAALETLFHRFADQLCAFAFAYTQSREAAEEIVQEIFIRLWQQRSTLEVPRSISSYLYAGVRNRSLNAIRDRSTELRIHARQARDPSTGAIPRPFPQPDAVAEAHDLRDALGRAVAAMPLRCREVFVLARNAQLTYAEIAGVLGISPRTVEIHMSRALAFLRERLAAWRGD